jgi:hypothetical protein
MYSFFLAIAYFYASDSACLSLTLSFSSLSLSYRKLFNEFVSSAILPVNLISALAAICASLSFQPNSSRS